jgi:hypothetical protein
MRKDFKRRNSLTYKVKFWLFHLTGQEVKKALSLVVYYGIEFLMCALALGLIFFGPAFLH